MSNAAIMQRADKNKYLSYRRETAMQGGLVMAKSGRLELGDNVYEQYRYIFNHCDVFGQQKIQVGEKKCKIRAINPFSVIQGHRDRYQSKARMRLAISD